MSEKLLPCPFCGSDDIHVTPAETNDGFDACCGSCTASVWAVRSEDAALDWNTRTPGPATAAMYGHMAAYVARVNRVPSLGRFPFDIGPDEAIRILAEHEARTPGDKLDEQHERLLRLKERKAATTGTTGKVMPIEDPGDPALYS